MQPIQTIDIVIPVYNEGENIIPILEAFERNVKSPIRVLICYDHDTDNTLTVIRDRKFLFDVVPVKNKGKFAHGASVTGLYYDQSPAAICYMADDDYNTDKIDAMIDVFRNGADIVVASRFIPGGNMVGCRWQKAIPVRIAAYTLHLLGRLPAHDPTNAFRLFSRKLLNSVQIESSLGFTFSIELLVKAHRMKMKIVEVPVSWIERKKGSSRFKIMKWAKAYLRWYFYAFGTTYFRKTALK